MVRLLIALMLFSGAAHAASYTKPAGAPEVFVPSYGVTVGVWAAQTAVGHGIGVFEKSGSGDWTLCFNCLASVEYPNLDAVVSAAGGAGPYVAGQIAAVNAILASRYPSVVAEPTTTLDKVNASIGFYALRLVNGSPVLGAK